MWMRSAVILLVLSICCGDLYDTVIQKDEEVTKIFNEPEGNKDSDMFNAMRDVGDAYDLLKKHLRIRNCSVADMSKRLYDRGAPNVLTEVFSTDSLRVAFNWVDSDMRYFNYLYNDVQNKWNAFESEYKNASMYM